MNARQRETKYLDNACCDPVSGWDSSWSNEAMRADSTAGGQWRCRRHRGATKYIVVACMS